MSRWSADGQRYRRARRQVLAQSTVCWLCGHDGADQADHVVPVSRGGAVNDPANLRPAHGTNACPTCGRRCNQERNRRPRPAPGPDGPSRAW